MTTASPSAHSYTKRVFTSAILAGIGAFCIQVSVADPVRAAVEPSDLKALSIEELMSIKVTSASKRPQRLSDVAAAVYVLSGDDLRRAGVANIPDALRLVPGVNVARIDANKWAISARGFNGRFANKLQVLIDGRSVYSPVFSGVFWDQRQVMIQDIDRIEIIRGPGASVWGANAVNGVINIITKTASDTQGTLAAATGGTEEQELALRHGAPIGDTGHARIFARGFRRDTGELSNGGEGNDDWRFGHFGFRSDLALSQRDSLIVEGEGAAGESNQTSILPTLSPPFAILDDDDTGLIGGSALARWTRQLSPESHLATQVYWDYNRRDGIVFDLEESILDFEVEHRFQPVDRHDVVWGLGYSLADVDADPGTDVVLNPASRTTSLFSFFVQDEIAVVPDEVRITVGTKLEHNDRTGFEIQPTGRILWTPSPAHSIWGAVSRAVRSPSRSEVDGLVNQQVAPGPGGLPVIVQLRGNEDFKSEELVAFEAGYRIQAMERLSLDFAAFYNIYDNLRSFETGAIEPNLPTGFIQPVVGGNKLEGESWGLELATEWEIRDDLRIRGTYSYLDLDLRLDGGSTDASTVQAEGESPAHQLSIRSSYDVTDDLDLDITLRAVDELPALGTDGHFELDLRLAWRPTSGVELSLVGQNLLHESHEEFQPEILGVVPTEVERAAYVQARIHF